MSSYWSYEHIFPVYEPHHSIDLWLHMSCGGILSQEHPFSFKAGSVRAISDPSGRKTEVDVASLHYCIDVKNKR